MSHLSLREAGAGAGAGAGGGAARKEFLIRNIPEQGKIKEEI